MEFVIDNKIILQTMVDSLILTDAAGVVLLVNPATLKMLECSENDIIGKPLINFMAVNSSLNDIKNVFKYNKNLTCKNGILNNYEIDFITKTGKYIPVSLNISTIKNSNSMKCLKDNKNDRCEFENDFPCNVIQGFVCIARDISNIKMFLTSIKQSNEELLEKIRTLEVFKKDIEGKKDIVLNIFDDINKTNKEPAKTNNEMLKMQDERIRTEKLKSLGLLVAGVVHEINNPLTGILGYTQLLLKNNKLLHENEIIEDLKCIEMLSNRTRNIVKGLLLFAREERFELLTYKLQDILDEILNLLFYDLTKSKIKVEIDKSITDKIVQVSKQHFQQVFFNLFMNSIHAMSDIGGRININSEYFMNDNKEFIRIFFSDTGKGIPENILSKIFEPFFTTKNNAGGTGLGLFISYNIIKQHGGNITVNNKANVGAEFIITLPCQ